MTAFQDFHICLNVVPVQRHLILKLKHCLYLTNFKLKPSEGKYDATTT